MKSILIVDDDRAVLDLLETKLRTKYRTLATTNPQEALAIARDKRPDLVLCDMDMPQMNGMELATQVRKQSAGKMPVLFLTGLVTADEARTANFKGEQVVAKTAPIGELLDRIGTLIGA